MNEPTKNIYSLVSCVFLGDLHYDRREKGKEGGRGGT